MRKLRAPLAAYDKDLNYEDPILLNEINRKMGLRIEDLKNKINNPTKKVKRNIVKKNVPSLKSLGLESKPQESDLARLKRQDKERKAFESEALSRKKAQTSKLKDPLIERAKKSLKEYSKKGSPKIGFTPKAFSIKGASGPAGKKLKRMSSGGEVKASKYYYGGGKIFTGR